MQPACVRWPEAQSRHTLTANRLRWPTTDGVAPAFSHRALPIQLGESASDELQASSIVRANDELMILFPTPYHARVDWRVEVSSCPWAAFQISRKKNHNEDLLGLQDFFSFFCGFSLKINKVLKFRMGIM